MFLNILGIIVYGARTGYFGPQCSRFTLNSLSARQYADALSEQIQTKVRLIQFVEPFKTTFPVLHG